MQIKYWLLLILLGAVWGSSFIFIKIATPEFGPIAFVGLRLLLAGSLFLPFLLMPKYLNQIHGHIYKILFLSLFNNRKVFHITFKNILFYNFKLDIKKLTNNFLIIKDSASEKLRVDKNVEINNTIGKLYIKKYTTQKKLINIIEKYLDK